MKDASFENSIFELYYDDVYRYCLAKLYGDEQAAEDAAGDVFVIAKAKSKELARHPDPKGWLFLTAKNVVRNIRKRDRRYRRRFPLTDPAGISALLAHKSAAAPWDDALSLFDPDSVSDEEIESVKAALLSELDPEERELITAYYEKGVPIRELAEKLGISPGAVRMRITRISAKLTDRVKNIF